MCGYMCLRWSNVKVVDVEARSRHSSQRGGNGEEGHSQGVVTACISCCHQEHCWSNHTYRTNARHKVKIPPETAHMMYWMSKSVPYQQGRRPSWRGLWGRGRFPEDNQQPGHSAQPTQHSPGKAEQTAYHSVVDRMQFYIYIIITHILSVRSRLTVLFHHMVLAWLDSTRLFWFFLGQKLWVVPATFMYHQANWGDRKRWLTILQTFFFLKLYTKKQEPHSFNTLHCP